MSSRRRIVARFRGSRFGGAVGSGGVTPPPPVTANNVISGTGNNVISGTGNNVIAGVP